MVFICYPDIVYYVAIDSYGIDPRVINFVCIQLV